VPTAVFDTMAKRGERILAEKEGVPFRLEPENAIKKEDIWANYDPRNPSRIEEKCGRVQGVDTEELKLDIHNQREQDSHGCPA
jgi:hypothetical protein